MHNRINFSSLEDRLDAEYYSEEQLKNKATLEEFGVYPFHSICSGINVGYTGELTSQYRDTGTILYRVSDIEGLFLNEDEVNYVPVEFANKNEQIWIKNGDIVLAAVGNTVGKVAVKSSGIKNGVCSRALMISRPIPDKIDSHFLVAYLGCKFGQKSLIRGISGSAQPVLNTPLIANLPIIDVNLDAQYCIGQKLRQAELLMKWATIINSKVNHYHTKYIPEQSKLDFERKTRIVTNKQMTERMDAHFYPGVVDAYLKDNDGGFEKLTNCCIEIFNGQTQPENNEALCKQITVTNLSPSFIKGDARLVEKPKTKGKFLKKFDLLICNAAHQKSYIGRDITFNHSDQEILPSTEVMVIRADRNKVPASYLRVYFQTKLGFTQIQSTIRGITAHSYPVDMEKLDIFIPKLTDKDKAEWFDTDAQLRVAGIASELAAALTHVSKLLVEALIEGRVTENQLIEAQQALEDGDNSKDRAILSKITDQGYLSEGGKPLFTDLDKLYELLDEAKVAEDADEESV